MRISIIIPTYNSAKTIKTCIDGILAQSYSIWEILIIDGVSSDNTIEIVRSYRDNRIRIFSEPDKGIYDAMNKGIDKATGDWLYFLGSDDSLYGPTILEQVSKYLQPGIDVVYGEVNSSAWTEPFGEWSFGTLWSNRCHQSVFYSKRFFDDGHRYDLHYRIWADHDINLRWFLLPQYKSQYMPIVVANYGVGGFSASRSDEVFAKDFGLKVLRYGGKTLPLRWKKEYARDYIRHNGDKMIMCALMNVFISVLRMKDKLAR